MRINKRVKEDDGVEGILDGKAYELLDNDQDGRIMIHEYYPLTEEEVVKKILEVDNKNQIKNGNRRTKS